ncbi:MAG: HAD family hydrolase [Candidatus Binataceae bacterium]
MSGLNRQRISFPNLWLFDFDRTLAILEPVVDWPRSRKELEAELRASEIPAPLLDELSIAIPQGNLRLYAALWERLLEGPPSRRPMREADARAVLERASAIITRNELAGVDRAEPTPGAAEILHALAGRGIAAAIVTSNSSRTVIRWLSLHGVAQCVREIVGRDSGLRLKPAPAMIARAVELFGAKAGDALFIGDSVDDFHAADSSGVRFYAIASDGERRAVLTNAGARDIFASPASIAAHFGIMEIRLNGKEVM